MSFPFSNGEEIFVYRQPNRKTFNPFTATYGSSFEPPLEEIQPQESWLDRFKKRFEPNEGEERDWTDPTYWVYLLVAFAILCLLIYGIYWIVQNARMSMMSKRNLSNNNYNYYSSNESKMGKYRLSKERNQDNKLLTFSPSTGLIPTKPGSIIYGGNGREICLGCTSIRCDPSQANSFEPFVSANSLSAKCGQGYKRDPFQY